jgi:hypothetical protein
VVRRRATASGARPSESVTIPGSTTQPCGLIGGEHSTPPKRIANGRWKNQDHDSVTFSP